MTYLQGAERFYDLFGAKEDASFYIELAKKSGNNALELGVGTARLAIQLARAGIETWGIDSSPHMLKTAKRNIEKEPKETRKRLHIELADVRNFDLEKRFRLIYFPSHSFDHLLSPEDQRTALQNIRRHVAPGGVFAFDLAHLPEVKAEGRWFVQRKPYEEDRIVVRTGYMKANPEKRTLSIDLWYDLYENGRMLDRYHEGGEVYIHSTEGVKQLLRESGFEIIEWYGGHDKRDFDSVSETMVIIAKPS